MTSCILFADRKKDLVKLQHGEYISLSKVETSLKLCPIVDNVCLYAESTKNYTVALVVPNRKNVEALAKQLGITNMDWQHLCTNSDVEQAVLSCLNEYGLKCKYFYEFSLNERFEGAIYNLLQ
jgi:long-chain acyl-CoA synthetase